MYSSLRFSETSTNPASSGWRGRGQSLLRTPSNLFKGTGTFTHLSIVLFHLLFGILKIFMKITRLDTKVFSKSFRFFRTSLCSSSSTSISNPFITHWSGISFFFLSLWSQVLQMYILLVCVIKFLNTVGKLRF